MIVASTFTHGWAIDAQGAGQRAHFFRAHGDRGDTLCGLRVPMEWLHYPDERARCVVCSTALNRDRQGTAGLTMKKHRATITSLNAEDLDPDAIATAGAAFLLEMFDATRSLRSTASTRAEARSTTAMARDRQRRDELSAGDDPGRGND